MLRELHRELANEKRLIQEEMNDRSNVIQQLKDTIQEINSLTVSEQKYIKKEVKAHEQSVKLNCQHREAALKAQQSLLKKKIEQEQKAHEKIIVYLSDQRKVLESQIQEWMDKYETDIEAKTNELELLKQQRTRDIDKFEEMVTMYETLERIVDEDKALKAKDAEEKTRLAAKARAALVIQKWYRKWHKIRSQLVKLFNIVCQFGRKRQKGEKGK
jgi:hypothetical protein